MNDMTQGNPFRQIFCFMLPVFLGNLFQNLYNIVDLIIVGQFLDANALAAIGSTSAIVFLVIGWILGLTTGFGVLVAQAFGAKNFPLLRRYVAISAYICIAFTVVMTIGLLCANDWILHQMNTPAEIFESTKSYIAVIYAGLAASFLYNMLAAIARALGDSKTPLYFLAFSSVLNIGLDLLFVAVLPFGVAGAGYATVLAQVVSSLACLVYVLKKYPEIHVHKEEAVWDSRLAWNMMQMGIPMALQFSITAVGVMIVQASLNLLGANYIAAFSGTSKLQSIIMQVPIAIGAAIATYVGQNKGAGRMDRVQEGVRASVFMLVGFGCFVMVVAYFWLPQMIVMFTPDPTGELAAICQQYFHTVLWFYVPLSLIFLYRNALQGLGNGFVPLMGGVFELFARWAAVTLLFEPLQFVGIALADPCAWLSALIPLVPYYYWYMKTQVAQ